MMLIHGNLYKIYIILNIKLIIKQSIINFVYGQNKIYLRMYLLIFTKKYYKRSTNLLICDATCINNVYVSENIGVS